jgi:hypothetical protein
MEVLYPECAGLDVHKNTVVACVRRIANGTVRREVRTYKTTRICSPCRTGLPRRDARTSRWKRPASTGSRCGMS